MCVCVPSNILLYRRGLGVRWWRRGMKNDPSQWYGCCCCCTRYTVARTRSSVVYTFIRVWLCVRKTRANIWTRGKRRRWTGGGEKGDDWVAASADADARIHIEKKKKRVVVVMVGTATILLLISRWCIIDRRRHRRRRRRFCCLWSLTLLIAAASSSSSLQHLRMCVGTHTKSREAIAYSAAVRRGISIRKKRRGPRVEQPRY